MLYSFSPAGGEYPPPPADGKEAIPEAFGYRPGPPAVRAGGNPSVQNTYSRVGVIRDERSSTTVYYRNEKGGIVIREE
jgi:hypothetical protein